MYSLFLFFRSSLIQTKAIDSLEQILKIDARYLIIPFI